MMSGGVRNTIAHLLPELQGLNPIATNALHIRGSVIMNWLKIHPKRQVQYMAGHKHISSTGKYAARRWRIYRMPLQNTILLDNHLKP
ncbi:hypothetical protein [Paraflavitalea speifideaquila]|uniref:hypothetical protein n=1 Tax=Paraflavitalea speifideaquila TaxID=3076558 RepID=UPI0028EDE4A6|nr:hypothetical protein [Paraflavitalea speifideiaquila]